jgi:hypothetical protein
MELLGIDEKRGGSKNEDRNWPGVKNILLKTIATFEEMKTNMEHERTGLGMLKAEALTEVVDTLERQMEMVPFFNESGDGQKPEGTPLTNCCCESFMADLDNTLKVSGGTTTVRTISNKQIIKTNGYLES